MNVRLVQEKFIRLVRGYGLWKALRISISYLRPRPTSNKDDAFDAVLGTDTGGKEPLWTFRIDSPNARFGVRYEPSDERVLDQALKFMGEDPRNLTFIDIGCGKGRVLLLALKLGFKKIVGVEFVPELARIAEANMEKVGASNVTVINTDAARFFFPDDDCVTYLNNPFGPEVMRFVVDNLREARSTKRFVVYTSPYCADLFDSSGFLSRMGSVPETSAPMITWALAKQEATGGQ